MASSPENDDLYSIDYPNPPREVLQSLNHTMSDTDELPKYSNWEHRYGTLAPIDSDSESAPSRPNALSMPPTLEREMFDRNVSRFNEERDQEEEANAKQTLASELMWRAERFHNAETQRERGNVYRYLRPWNLELRLRCASHIDLLEIYYEIEYKVGQRLRAWYELTRGEVPHWETDKIQLCYYLLRKLMEARVKDQREDGDFIILGNVLQDVEMRLNEQILRMADGVGWPGMNTEVVVDLPEYIALTMYGHPDLSQRLLRMQDLERECFPARFENQKRSLNGLSPTINGNGDKMDEDVVEIADGTPAVGISQIRSIGHRRTRGGRRLIVKYVFLPNV